MKFANWVEMADNVGKWYSFLNMMLNYQLLCQEGEI